MAEPQRITRLRVLEGVQPPDAQIARIRDLLVDVGFCERVDIVERKKRANAVARAIYEQGGLSLQEVHQLWDHCRAQGRDPTALLTWKIRQLLGGWPW